jgi:hypothetical protein
VWLVAPRNRLSNSPSKTRRKKCDETKPTCQKCISGGFVCDGYPSAPPKKWQTSNAPVLAAKPHQIACSSRGSLIIDLPRTLLVPGHLEAYYYTHFFTNTIYDMEISESLNRNFWQKSFQGPSQNVSCVRHAVMALGAVHWQFTTCGHDKPSNLEGFTLSHYNDAISGLIHERGSANDSTTDLVTILTCCILFAILESLRGNSSEAIRHIKSGTELIANHKTSTYLPNNDIEELAAMFHAIGGQVGLFSPNRIFADITPFMAPKKKYNKPAGKLRDLGEAEDVMNTFDDVVTHISWDLEQDQDGNNSECEKQWAILRQRLQVWDTQFRAMVRNLVRTGEYTRNLERIVNLKIQYKLWELLLADESPVDGCNNQPTGRLDAVECSLLLDDLDRLWSKSKQPLYGLKTDLTTALFQLYVFCDDVAVRLRIISMLRSRRRREILWDSLELAGFLERDMARRAAGCQTEIWPDIGPSPDESALIVFRT